MNVREGQFNGQDKTEKDFEEREIVQKGIRIILIYIERESEP